MQLNVLRRHFVVFHNWSFLTVSKLTMFTCYVYYTEEWPIFDKQARHKQYEKNMMQATWMGFLTMQMIGPVHELKI